MKSTRQQYQQIRSEFRRGLKFRSIFGIGNARRESEDVFGYEITRKIIKSVEQPYRHFSPISGELRKALRNQEWRNYEKGRIDAPRTSRFL